MADDRAITGQDDAPGRDEKGKWLPGQSGNPAGPGLEVQSRPKLAHWLRVYIDEGDAGLERAPEKAQEIIRSMVRDAIARPQFDKDGNAHDGPGCPTTRGQIFDRHDGKLTQPVEHTVIEEKLELVDRRKRPAAESADE